MVKVQPTGHRGRTATRKYPQRQRSYAEPYFNNVCYKGAGPMHIDYFQKHSLRGCTINRATVMTSAHLT